ncbi:MAG: lactate racemase domain-containing protein [Acidobacteriota bacterium]|nr:lactate racemase domain-containing protein [Acidobacteriota bacterium]
MGMIADLLVDIALPKMARVRQEFAAPRVEDVAAAVRDEIRRAEITRRVKPGMRIAVGVGSRGMAEIALIVHVTIEELKRLGAAPFIVPAMGSHGGATAEGQKQVLASLGVTEESAGCPIRAGMDVVEVGRLKDGLAVLIDKEAFEADGIVVINRIRAHNAFSGPNESGLVKMITIGLGNQKGADAAHVFGFGRMAELSVEMAKVKLAKLPFLFGVGTVENAYDRVARIAAIPAEQIIEAERELLAEAKRNMPRLLLQPMDILIVDQLGKEFSGGGMDPYITGRAPTPFLDPGPTATRVVVLDVTERSHGNSCGVGMADITTRRLFNKMDLEYTYANILTSTVTASARIGLIMESDRLAIQAAVKTCNAADLGRVRMVRIANTLEVGEILVSESMMDDARRHADIAILGDPRPWSFNAGGDLADVGVWHRGS